jgi:quinol monooxygenase YgiN
MSEVVVVVSFRFKAGREDEGVELLRGVIEDSHGEPGCRLYALHREADDPTRFAIVEKWDSQDDLDAHFRQPHMAGITQAVDLLEEPPQVWFTQPVAIGDPVKGAL